MNPKVRFLDAGRASGPHAKIESRRSTPPFAPTTCVDFRSGGIFRRASFSMTYYYKCLVKSGHHLLVFQ